MHALPDTSKTQNFAALARCHYAVFAAPTVLLAILCASLFVLWIYLFRVGVFPFWLAFPLQTYTLIVMFNPLHEAVHGNITFAGKGGRTIDAAVGTLAGAALLQPYPVFRHMHLTHHARTNVAGVDPDLWTKAEGLPAVALRCLTVSLFYHWRYARHVFSQPRDRRPWGGIVMSALVLAIAAIAAVLFPLEAIGLWIVPAILAIAAIEFLHWTLHEPHDSDRPYENAKALYAKGWRNTLLRVLYQDLNCHLIHHLYPHVPFYRLSGMLPQIAGNLRQRGGKVLSVKQAYRQFLERRARRR